MLIHFRNN